MDNHNVVLDFVVFVVDELVSNDSNRLYNPCKISVAESSAPNNQTDRDKIFAISKLYRENTKYVRKSHTLQTEKIKNKKEESTRAMDTLILKNEKLYFNI